MTAEYKRDMNHSYLVLTGETEADTSSYPVRMLLGNTVPALLKCHLQGLDGKSLFYYEITSRQSLSSFYENRLLGTEDLRFLLGCLIQTLEKLEEYLLEAAQMVLNPDYIFLDLEKKELRFCFLPGYNRPVDGQFRMLIEYLLPKLDHGEAQAVSLGYGIYRKALEDQFQLETLRKALYQEGGETIPDEKPEKAIPLPQTSEEDTALPDDRKEKSEMDDLWERMGTEDSEEKKGMGDKEVTKNKKKKKSRDDQEEQNDQRNQHDRRKAFWIPIAGGLSAAGIILLILLASKFGYLPQFRVEIFLGCVTAAAGIGILLYVGYTRLLKKPVGESDPLENIQTTGEIQTFSEKAVAQEDNSEKIAGSLSALQPGSEIRKGNAWKTDAEDAHETVVLSMGKTKGPASLVSREPGELATIYLSEELTVIGKMKTAADAVIPLPTVSRLHAKIRKRDEEYYLTDLNSRNGTSVNGRMLYGEEEYQLQDEDEIDFAQARYIFLK